MKIKKITVQLDDGTVDHAFDHGVEAGYDLGTHVSDNFDFLLNSIGYRKQSEGEWIVVYEYNDYRMRKEAKIACSVCGHKPKYEGYLSDMNYCPNCGAKMKGGAE